MQRHTLKERTPPHGRGIFIPPYDTRLPSRGEGMGVGTKKMLLLISERQHPKAYV